MRALNNLQAGDVLMNTFLAEENDSRLEEIKGFIKQKLQLSVLSLTKLSGGKNSQVYKIASADKQFILKVLCWNLTGKITAYSRSRSLK